MLDFRFYLLPRINGNKSSSSIMSSSLLPSVSSSSYRYSFGSMVSSIIPSILIARYSGLSFPKFSPMHFPQLSQTYVGSKSQRLHSPHSMHSRSYKTQRFSAILFPPCSVCSLYHYFVYRTSCLNANVRLIFLAFFGSFML